MPDRGLFFAFFYSVAKKVPRELTVAFKLLPSLLAPVCSVDFPPSNKNNFAEVGVSEKVIVKAEFFAEELPAVKIPYGPAITLFLTSSGKPMVDIVR